MTGQNHAHQGLGISELFMIVVCLVNRKFTSCVCDLAMSTFLPKCEYRDQRLWEL